MSTQTSPPLRADRSRRGRLAVLLLTIFLDIAGFGILIPVIPLLLAAPGSPYYLLPPGTSAGHGYVLLGALVSVYPFCTFVATPILGQLSDRFGRKPILVISLAGTSLSYVLFALGIVWRDLPLLFAARALDGVTGGNISVAQASMADVTPPEQRTRTFGLMGATFGLAMIVGPVLGGKLSDPRIVRWFDAATPFWFAAILSASNVGWLLWQFQETHTEHGHEPLHPAQSIGNIVKAFGTPGLRTVFLTVSLFMIGFTFFTSFFSVYLVARFHFTQGDIGNFFAAMGVCNVLSQTFLVRRVADVIAEDRVLRFSLFGVAACIGAYLLPSAWWGLYCVVPFMSVCMGLTMANLTGLVSKSADRTMQGRILGINASVQALGQLLPPFASGLVAARLGPQAPVLLASGFVTLAGAAFVATHAGNATTEAQRHRERQTAQGQGRSQAFRPGGEKGGRRPE